MNNQTNKQMDITKQHWVLPTGQTPPHCITSDMYPVLDLDISLLQPLDGRYFLIYSHNTKHFLTNNKPQLHTNPGAISTVLRL